MRTKGDDNKISIKEYNDKMSMKEYNEYTRHVEIKSTNLTTVRQVIFSSKSSHTKHKQFQNQAQQSHHIRPDHFSLLQHTFKIKTTSQNSPEIP